MGEFVALLRELADPLIKWVVRKTRERPRDAVALGAVPLLTLALIATEIGAPWSFSGGDGLTVARLATSGTPGSQTSQSVTGLMMIVEPEMTDFFVEWGANDRRYWVSLDQHSLQANNRRLIIDERGIELKDRLLGPARPLVLIAEGVAGTEILTKGGRLSVEDLQFYSRQSLSLALAGLTASLFGLGLATATLNQRVARRRTGPKPKSKSSGR